MDEPMESDICPGCGKNCAGPTFDTSAATYRTCETCRLCWMVGSWARSRAEWDDLDARLEADPEWAARQEQERREFFAAYREVEHIGCLSMEESKWIAS